MRGLKKGYVSVISGLRASGKSSVISEICLDCVETRNNAGVFSGELSPKNFMRWMNLQAAGKGYVEPTRFDGYYNVRKQYQAEIAEWLGNHFFLYNKMCIRDSLYSLMEQRRLTTYIFLKWIVSLLHWLYRKMKN